LGAVVDFEKGGRQDGVIANHVIGHWQQAVLAFDGPRGRSRFRLLSREEAAADPQVADRQFVMRWSSENGPRFRPTAGRGGARTTHTGRLWNAERRNEMDGSCGLGCLAFWPTYWPTRASSFMPERSPTSTMVGPVSALQYWA
jgi:hypothetical protein